MRHEVGRMIYYLGFMYGFSCAVTASNGSVQAGENCGPRDCYEARYCTYSNYRGQGVFPSSLAALHNSPVKAYCEPEQLNQGGRKVWTTLLNRNREELVSETDFSRASYADYQRGFGDSRNGWLGAGPVHGILDPLHDYRVRLLVNGVHVAACYKFKVAHEAQGYRAVFEDCTGAKAELLSGSNGRRLTKDCGSGDTYWWFDEGCTLAPTAKTTSDISLAAQSEPVNSLTIQFRMSGEQKCPVLCNGHGVCSNVSLSHVVSNLYIYIYIHSK